MLLELELLEPASGLLIELLGAALGSVVPVVAAALVVAPVEAKAVPDHQSLLARCLGVAAI